MSELSKIIPHRYFSIRVKLSAIRDRLLEELQKYNIRDQLQKLWKSN